jgi:hypothetical protein
MMNLLWILFAHFIGDFALQTEYMAKTKGLFWVFMFAHSAIYTGIVMIAFQYAGLPSASLFGMSIVIFVSHYCVDMLKDKIIISDEKSKKLTANRIKFYVIADQVFHLFVLIVVFLTGGVKLGV